MRNNRLCEEKPKAGGGLETPLLLRHRGPERPYSGPAAGVVIRSVGGGMQVLVDWERSGAVGTTGPTCGRAEAD